jgi:hypothetical protein
MVISKQEVHCTRECMFERLKLGVPFHPTVEEGLYTVFVLSCVTALCRMEVRPKGNEAVPWMSVCWSRVPHTDAVGRYPEAARPERKNHISLTGTRSFDSLDRRDQDGKGIERVGLAGNDRIKRIKCWTDASFMLDGQCRGGMAGGSSNVCR